MLIRRLFIGSMVMAGAFPFCASPARAQVTAAVDTARLITHTVKKGDTLWDIAQFYLKNPFRWPEIFQRNTDVVKNPHWIYPGEVIRIPISEVRPEALGASSAGTTTVVARIQTVSRPLTVFATQTAPVMPAAAGGTASRASAPGVRAGEIEAAPYVTSRGGPRFAGEILAAVDRPGIETSGRDARFQLNDQLYISPPAGQAPHPGDRLLAYVLGPEVGNSGQLVVPTAILEVNAVPFGQPVRARVVRQFGEIRLRQGLLIAPSVPPITGSTVAPTRALSGTVIHINEDPVLASLQQYLEISPALGDGVAVGDLFTLIDDKSGRADPSPAPPVAVAVAQVVRVTPFASTAIIISQSQPSIRRGMTVRLTGQMR